MTQEDKELLLQDLCARLPYKVKVHFKFEPDRGEMFESYGILESINNYSQVEINSDKLCGQLLSLEYNEVKPYLFPLSSMTEEQYNEFFEFYNNIEFNEVRKSGDYLKATYLGDMAKYEWLNKNNFDYRYLIPKDLALDATKLNIY